MNTHRIIRATIVIDANEPSSVDKIDRVLRQLGLVLLANGHRNVMAAELLTEECEHTECSATRAPVDPNLN
jgi:hypothetical protein